MAEKFVSVQQVTGQAWVRFDGGQLVLLREGMRIPEDAIITTAGNGAVQLVNEQGEVFAVTANQELPLNEASFQGGSGSTADVTAHNDQSTLIAALKDEQDPFAVLEDTESILNGGETAGGSFVRLDSIIERTSPMDLEYPKPSQVRDEVRRPNGVASGGEEPKQPGDVETPSTKPSMLSHEAKVFEAGLDAGGTEAATDKEFASGVFTFKSPDGVGSINFAGVTLAQGVDKTFVVQTQDIKGVITAQYTFNESTKTGEIRYTFELSEHTVDVANQQELLQLAVVLTDSDGDSAMGSVTIEVIDDAPIAHADTGTLQDGANTLTMDAASGVLANDQAGADGWGKVIGVEAGAHTTTTATGVGATITGSYGTLTLLADGSYTYERMPDASGSDVFTYTVVDRDGSLSLSTLTIGIDGVPTIDPVQGNPATGHDATTVWESGLAAGGTEAATDKEFASGVFTFKSPDGVGSITLGGTTLTLGVDKTFAVDSQGIKGLVTAQYTFNESTKTGEIHYTFELTERTEDVANQQELLPLEVVLVDADGDKATSTLSIEVIDDSPVTSADMGNVTEGVVLTVTAADGVLSNDQAGADHWNSAGGVVGVSAGGKLGILNGSGFEIQGLYGKLTLNTDGSYTYAARTLPNAQTLGEAQESFTYTVRDGDGDEKTATLVIDVNQFAVAGNENNNITGGYGNDVLVGDVGGQQWVNVPGENYNIAMIIDNSLSMTELWEGRSRGDISKETVKFFVENHLLTHDGDVNLSLIDFHGVVRASVIGLNASNYLEMIDAIDNIAFNVLNTPYARGFDTAKAWFETEDVALSHNAGYKNITYLLTDGDPIGEGLDKRAEAFEALNEVSYVNLIGIGDIGDKYYVGQFDSGTQLSHHSTVVDFSAMSENDVKNWRFIGNPNDLYVGNVLVSDYYKPAMISWVNSGSSMELLQPDSIFITDASGGYLTFLASASNASIEAVWSLERFDGATWVVVESHQFTPSVVAFNSQLTQLHPPGEYRFKFDITSSNAQYKTFTFSSIELLSGDYVPGIDIVKNPEDLIDTFIEGYKKSVPVAVGDDVLYGGFGDDVLFGDAINTDHLMWSGRNDYPEGSGLAALKAFLADTLYQGVMPTDSQIHQYLVAHHEDFNNENSLDARGGNDQLSGGAGNDVLYGQVGDDLLDGGDGNDILYGGLGSDQLIGGAGDDVLRGGAGNDQLHGGSGNDVIHGGQGDDILVGGDGDDIFVWDANDQGGVSNPAYDVIKDFSLSSNDVLDFSDLLNNQFGDDLTSFLYFEKSGDDTVIKISADGGLSNNGVAFDQQITLENVDFSAYGNMDDQAALIQTLIEQGKIIVD